MWRNAWWRRRSPAGPAARPWRAGASTLDKHAYPVLGDLRIGDVTRDHVVQALTSVWTAQPATARKLQRRIASVLDYATALK
ncbi:phage integrase central domain-containing protein [Pararoseomonas sp. SCSIO 73927]|uniref:phage integrase central domain-containing protein n=1 Tax=Pararoseomonas sp. SCSIO 73927 TaxID=3114537 RepID=UPI0038D0BD4D